MIGQLSNSAFKTATRFALLLVFAIGVATRSEDSISAEPSRFYRDGQILAPKVWCGLVEVIEGEKSEIFKKLDELDLEADSAVIDSLLGSWLAMKDFQTRPDTPNENEWLIDFAKRLDYCCEKLHQERDRFNFRDLLVRAVILNGIPAEHDIDYSDTSETHHFVFRTGLVSSFTRDLAGGKPWKTVTHPNYRQSTANSERERKLRMPDQKRKPGLLTLDERIFLSPKIERTINPTFALASFSNNDGTYSVWAASAVHAEQAKVEKSDQVRLVRRAVLYRNYPNDPQVVAVDSAGMLFAVPDEKKQVLYPFCWPHELPSGDYNLTLAVYDDNGGLGIIAHEFSLPSRLASKGISDILLTQGLAEQDLGGSANRVLRDGWSMRANSYPVYYQGDSIYFYVESNFAEANFKADKNGKYQYRVYCNLLPANKAKREGTTESGEPYVLRDSTDARQVEKMIRERDRKSKSDENLVYSISRTSHNAQISIHDAAVLPRITKGEYYFTLRVADALSEASLIALKTVFVK